MSLDPIKSQARRKRWAEKNAVTFVCENCGETVTKPYQSNSKHLYCSRDCSKINAIGNKHWLGRKHTDETRKKMSENRYAHPIIMRGEDHPNWKGGCKYKKKFPERVPRSPDERMERIDFRYKLQKKIFERDNFICQICEQVGGKLQIHHLKSWAKYPELRFEESNCQTLCMTCHYYITFKKAINPQIIWGHDLKKVESRLL